VSPVPGAPPPPKPAPTPTPQPNCGQTGLTEPGAPPGYVSDPDGPQGADHPDYAADLNDLIECDAFRASLPPGTNMGTVDDDIDRGCSESWIRANLP
jgi:hypothetical protein